MPWKNGGGSTTEIAISPDFADLATFDWRISTARVETPGPFSTFSGCDRTLCVIEGEGLVLTGLGPDSVYLTGESQPYAFPADKPVDCALLGGLVTDLNVMTRRGHFAHDVIRLKGGAPDIRIPETGTIAFIFAPSAVSLLFEGEQVALADRDAILIEGGTSVGIMTDGSAEPAYLMLLRPLVV
jgi:environmental stress-induced protein Ves